MKSALLSLVAVAMGTVAAVAADPYVPPSFGATTTDWSGFYAGIVAGAGLLNTTMSDTYEYISYGSMDLSGWGGSLGATAGYQQQFGSAVVGIEADINWASLGVSFYDSQYDTQHDRSWDWYSTLRFRGGLAMDNALVYATAGIAAVGVNFVGDYEPENDCGDNYGFCLNETMLGLTVGAGAEFMVSDNMTFKLEGLYIGLPSTVLDDVYDEEDDMYVLASEAFVARAGLNFRF